MNRSVVINGQLEVLRNNSNTHVNNLDVLLYATTLGANASHDVAISGEDLHKLELIQDSVEIWARSSIQAVGQLLARVDQAELPDHCLIDVGWLLAGIGELMDALADSGVTLAEMKAKQADGLQPVARESENTAQTQDKKPT